MKNTIKRGGLSVLLTLCISFTVQANLSGNTSSQKNEIAKAILKDNLVGGWSYTVEGAPAGYEKGLLMVIKENDAYKVQIQIGGATLLGENIKVSGNKLNFEVMVEGGRVKVDLTAKGDTISGKSTSPDGSYTINGKKTLSMD